MDEQVAKIIGDLELAIISYERAKDKSDKDTIKIAYCYRLNQLSKYGTITQYHQYCDAYERMTTELVCSCTSSGQKNCPVHGGWK